MVILLAGQKVGSLGHRDPTTVLLALEMCLDVTWLKLTTVRAYMRVWKLQEQMQKLCQLRSGLLNFRSIFSCQLWIFSDIQRLVSSIVNIANLWSFSMYVLQIEGLAVM